MIVESVFCLSVGALRRQQLHPSTTRSSSSQADGDLTRPTAHAHPRVSHCSPSSCTSLPSTCTCPSAVWPQMLSPSTAVRDDAAAGGFCISGCRALGLRGPTVAPVPSACASQLPPLTYFCQKTQTASIFCSSSRFHFFLSAQKVKGAIFQLLRAMQQRFSIVRFTGLSQQFAFAFRQLSLRFCSDAEVCTQRFQNCSGSSRDAISRVCTSLSLDLWGLQPRERSDSCGFRSRLSGRGGQCLGRKEGL